MKERCCASRSSISKGIFFGTKKIQAFFKTFVFLLLIGSSSLTWSQVRMGDSNYGGAAYHTNYRTRLGPRPVRNTPAPQPISNPIYNGANNNSNGYSSLPSSYKELLSYITPSPDQKMAGSCLYMASTGAMEILVNKLSGITNPQVNGEYDLAEIYALNGYVPGGSKSWFEDPILRFNSGGMLSRDVPFIAETFWNSRLPYAPKIQLPRVNTLPLYVAPGPNMQSRFKFGLLNDSHIEQVKEALIKFRSPVVVIYREAGGTPRNNWDTWHTVVIVGYDDKGKEEGTSRCYGVEKAFGGFDPNEQNELRKVLLKGGGCRQRGIFYVRDSGGAGTGFSRAPLYDKRSYDWLKYLGNHIFVAYLDPNY